MAYWPLALCVKYPGASWTWADFNAAAAKLTDKAKGQYAIAANLSSAQEYMYDTIYQAGGYVISPDGKKSGYAEQATIIHGLANVVSAKTTHPAQAWQFVKFLGSQQSAEILGQHGVIPAYNGTQNAWVTAHAEFHLQAFLDQLAYAVPYPVSKNTAAWQELETKYLTPAWNGQVDVAKAAGDLAAAMDAALAKE